MASWYHADGDERLGPVEASEIERLIGTGHITRDTLVWRDGLDGWERADRHFAQAFVTPAPPPVPEGVPKVMARPDQHGNEDEQIGRDGLYVGAPSREFIEAAKVCLSKYATFSGRASRSEFWFFYLFCYVVMFVAQILDFAIIAGLASTGGPIFIPVFTLITTFGLLIPQIAASWRRLHDIDRTGWWLGGGMIAMVLFYGALFGFVVSQEASGTFDGEPPEAFFALFGLSFLVILGYAITLFIFYVTKGTLGPNRYG
ncbi:DUF805 domain-containing protein [Rhodobacterales bacterium HKCCE4037]|nr:DUF805 domain-containing protein [Rhodobacterales bacterium HKCCE4037]